jgi:hypothetical protein
MPEVHLGYEQRRYLVNVMKHQQAWGGPRKTI